MTDNELGDIPEYAKNLIQDFSDLTLEMNNKLVELWKLYEKLNNPNENPKYKPIDKYVVNDDLSQAEGEFNMFIDQISGISDKLPEINKEIVKSTNILKS
jgi:hypothetical protein